MNFLLIIDKFDLLLTLSIGFLFKIISKLDFIADDKKRYFIDYKNGIIFLFN